MSLFLYFVTAFLLAILSLVLNENLIKTRKRIEILEKNTIELNNKNNFLTKEVIKLIPLLDFVAAGIPNPFIREVYFKICYLPQFPNREELNKIMQQHSREVYLKSEQLLKEQISSTQDEEEKKILKIKLDKVNNARNLSDTLDHNSDPEYVKIVNEELKNIILEIQNLNENGGEF